ncbi:DUF5665 domain-containing protein [Thetidibacter halocola]|uniref:Uncharacterized protein n=1 Tax=Thetidibacter halocola TaxID=2827239 RepID=A0A8J7WGZ5_9RHOB|nr:DUF5665 domain-containing protein [Thetidibacter halocola]MBS0125153.1 hypothetical protein [Thetidibacter halocola]
MRDDSKTDESMARLAQAVETLNRHKFMRMHDSTLRMMWTQFLRGLALGLGTALGASVLVSGIVLVLTQFEWVPFLGEFATQIIDEIQIER